MSLASPASGTFPASKGNSLFDSQSSDSVGLIVKCQHVCSLNLSLVIICEISLFYFIYFFRSVVYLLFCFFFMLTKPLDIYLTNEAVTLCFFSKKKNKKTFNFQYKTFRGLPELASGASVVVFSTPRENHGVKTGKSSTNEM